MKLNKFLIINMTNMHIGSGGVGTKQTVTEYQKDLFTNAPIIPASGLKGSIRQYFNNQSIDDGIINKIFGWSDESSTESSKIMQSSITFLDAELIAYPVRINKDMSNSYLLMVKSAEDAKSILDLNVVHYEKYASSHKYNEEELYLENKKLKANEIEFYDEKNIIIVAEEIFNSIMMSPPVITRNKLDNGISQNVWHEEYVPRFSVFRAKYLSEDDKLNDKLVADLFKKYLNEANCDDLSKLIQIGGNASIGMGYSKIVEENDA